MARVELTIKFTDDAQSTRSEKFDIATSYPGDLAGEHRVGHILFAELKVRKSAIRMQPDSSGWSRYGILTWLLTERYSRRL